MLSLLRPFSFLLLLSLSSTGLAQDLERELALSKKVTRSFDEMMEIRAIRALVVRSRTNYFFDGAVQRGLTFDMLQAFEKQLNEELGSGHLKVHIIFLPVARDQLIAALLDGRGDIAAANLTISPERQQLVDFSSPLLKNVRELLVTGPGSTPLPSLESLSGATVHVRESSSYYPSLLEANRKLVAQGASPMQLVLADENLEDEDLLEMVNAGLIPAIVVDSHKANFWRQIYPDITVHENFDFRNGANIGWAFRKNTPGLADAVNAFVKKNRKGSLLGNILFKRYLQNTSYVRNALSTSEMAKFNATVDLFKTYADQYDFDWLMLMAQGYQESQLDNNTRSSAGAVGVMQLLPSTAADKNVGIDDVTDLENNIHAGAKYMRFIRDRYFGDADMDELEQTLFSFAAYNAGPARVARLRKEAEEMGLDPNVWFRNVEVVAAKRIGRETVQYVSNIFKYWIAYTLAQKAE